MQPMTIAQLAATCGVGVETVRFYQRRGLLRTPARGHGIRHYDAADRQRLGFIRSAQAAGFTLDGIRELMALDAVDDRPRVRALAETRIEALDARIAELQRARNALATLAQRCSRGEHGPCPILGAFDKAAAVP